MSSTVSSTNQKKEADGNPWLFEWEESARRLGMKPVTLSAHRRAGNVTAVYIGRRPYLNAKEMQRICEQGLPPLRLKKAKVQ